MNATNFNLVQIVTFLFVFVGVIVLIKSILLVLKFSKILKFNEYFSAKWNVVLTLIVFFIIGYSMHSLVVFNLFNFKLDPMLMVSLVYFFGAIFVLIAMNSIYSLVQTILGDLISDKEAFNFGLERIDSENIPEFFYNNFSIHCNECNTNLVYNIAQVVRQHNSLKSKGINIETTFGVKSIILQTTHKCKNGRREITTVHDETMAFRSIDKSKIIVGTDL